MSIVLLAPNNSCTYLTFSTLFSSRVLGVCFVLIPKLKSYVATLPQHRNTVTLCSEKKFVFLHCKFNSDSFSHDGIIWWTCFESITKPRGSIRISISTSRTTTSEPPYIVQHSFCVMSMCRWNASLLALSCCENNSLRRIKSMTGNTGCYMSADFRETTWN